MRHQPHPPQKKRSSGVSLLFALLSMAALTLGAVALVRSVDTGALVLGNLGLKQDATAVSDQAANRAIQWLSANSSSLDADSVDNGYYATSHEDLDVTGQQIPNDGSHRALVNWDVDECAYASAIVAKECKVTPSAKFVVNGNTYRYIILRLCDTKGDPKASGNYCAQPLTAGKGAALARGSSDYSKGDFTDETGGVYYRIVVRSVGARKTTSYVETIVHL